MAGISVTLDGENIQLSFEKGGQSTSVVMDPQAARSLVKALDQLLAAIGEEGENEESFEEMLDVTSPGIDVGTDESGLAVMALEAGPLGSFMLRLRDEEARHVANSLLEILNAPADARISLGGH